MIGVTTKINITELEIVSGDINRIYGVDGFQDLVSDINDNENVLVSLTGFELSEIRSHDPL